MSARRVFVIWTHPLFHESIRLLLRRPNVELVGATSDGAVGERQIAMLRPDVVIIEETEEEQQADARIMSVLQRVPKLIRLSLEDNQLILFQRQDRTVGQVADLLRLIVEDSAIDTPAGESG